MKRILVLLLALALLLAACTKEETQETANPTKEKATEAKTGEKTQEEASVWTEPGTFPVVNEPMEFDFFAAVFSSSAPLAENTMLKAYEEMTNVIINWEEVPESDQTEKLSLSLASGDYPDAYFNTNISRAQQFVYGQQGILVPLNDAIETVGVSIKKAYSDYPQIKKNSTAPDGNIYSLFQFDPALHMSTYNKMFINTEWVEASGLGMPTTIEEFQALLTYFRDNDMNGNGDATDEIPLVGSTGIRAIKFLANPFILNVVNGYQVSDDGIVSPVFTQPEYKEALRYVNGLYEEGLLGNESFTQDDSALRALVNRPEEMIVGAVGATLWQGAFLSFDQFERGTSTYSAVQPLVGPLGKAQHPWTNDGVSVGRSIQITKECEYPEVLIRLIDYFYSEEGAMWQICGVEGEHYNWIDQPALDGSVPSYTRIEEACLPPVSTFIQNQGPMFFTNELRYKETGGIEGTPGKQLYDDGMLYEQFVDYDRNYMPFTEWLSEEDTRAFSLLDQPIDDYREEAEVKFIIGDMDIDADWDTYISTLEDMGLNDLVKLKQSVYDGSN